MTKNGLIDYLREKILQLAVILHEVWKHGGEFDACPLPSCKSSRNAVIEQPDEPA